MSDTVLTALTVATAPARAPVAITHGGRERVGKAVALLAEAFRNDPVIHYMLCSLSEQGIQDYMVEYFGVLIKAAGLNDAHIHEAGGWSSCAVWMPPGKRVDNPWTMPRCGLFGLVWKLGWAGFKRMLIEFQPQADAIKKKTFKDRNLPFKYYYLFFIGTDKDHRRKGLGEALIRHYQEIAAKEDTPIWLESTTEDSMRLYAKCGFEEMAKIVLGKGVAGADGRTKKGGEGCPIWAMIWVPEGSRGKEKTVKK